MSPPYNDRGSSRRRGVWSHWVPLVVTVTVATVGVAAWVWSQRKDSAAEAEEEQDHVYDDLDYDNADYGDNPAYGTADNNSTTKPPSYRDGALRPGETGYGTTQGHPPSEAGWASQMSGALRRTPSPQQIIDSAKRTMSAGVTAVGRGLAAITEEDKAVYADHETWSEEADAKKERNVAPAMSKEASKRRKKVAIVVSADNLPDDFDATGFHHEHASILSHIPRNTDFSKIKLYILIYAPNLKDSALETANTLPPASLSSSFSNIDHSQAQTPGDDRAPLTPSSATDPAFNAVYTQAQGLVEKDSCVLTFTTPNGHMHILRHIQPEIIYLQESLAGENGSVVTSLQTWLRHDVILVVGAESGDGGLADSDSEAEDSGKKKEDVWWQREDRVGRGRGVVVVDGMRVHDDWARRVQGRE